MKFFTASLFVLLASAILGGSFATPAHKELHLGGLQLDGLIGGLVGQVDHLLENVLDGVKETVGNLSEAVRNVLSQLKPVIEDVVNAVKQILHETGKGLLFVVDDVVDGVLTFVAKTADGIITININIDTLEVCIGDKIIGTVREDGAIINHDGKIIGLLDSVKGALVIVGETVKDLLHNVVENGDELVNNLLQKADQLLGNILETVKNTVENITPAIRNVLDKLHSATTDVVNSVIQLLQETGKVLVCTVEEVTNNILTFREANGECLISVNLGTLKVTVGGRIIGTFNNENGSIVDRHGNVIGFLDSNKGLLVLVGDILGTLLCAVGGLLDGVLGLLG